MAFTLCTSAAAVFKAGIGANSAISGATLTALSDEAEGTINAITRKNWVSDYSTVTTNFRGILADTASSMIAFDMISHDLNGFPSRADAETRLDVLRDKIVRNIEVLKDEKNKEIMD